MKLISPSLLLIGERDEAKRAHLGIEASLRLFNQERTFPLAFDWLSTGDVALAAERLRSASGIWCVPGSPYASTEGALEAIRVARTRGIPFFGSCGGFQHALMEYASSVLHVPAVHAELDPEAPNPLVAKLSCSLAGATARIAAKPGSQLEALYGAPSSDEEFNCNYGVGASFQDAFDRAELEIVGFDAEKQPRVFWHRSHRFFVGTLFQPERRAFGGSLHPLVRAFLDTVASR